MLVLLRSKTYNIIDESLIFSSALFIPMLSTLSSVSRNPAVSVNLTILFPIVIVSSIKSLVVPGMSDTIALSSSSRELSRVDFPTFGFPNIITFIPSFTALFSLKLSISTLQKSSISLIRLVSFSLFANSTSSSEKSSSSSSKLDRLIKSVLKIFIFSEKTPLR